MIQQKRSKKKYYVSALLVLVLMFSMTGMAFAYSGNYSFDIGWSVTGNYDHNLDKKSTSTTVNADTYSQYTGTVLSDKEKFTVTLEKNWSLASYSTPQITADGYTYTKSFGTVSSGEYLVRVVKNTGDGNLQKVVGSGTINQ